MNNTLKTFKKHFYSPGRYNKPIKNVAFCALLSPYLPNFSIGFANVKFFSVTFQISKYSENNFQWIIMTFLKYMGFILKAFEKFEEKLPKIRGFEIYKYKFYIECYDSIQKYKSYPTIFGSRILKQILFDTNFFKNQALFRCRQHMFKIKTKITDYIYPDYYKSFMYSNIEKSHDCIDNIWEKN